MRKLSILLVTLVLLQTAFAQSDIFEMNQKLARSINYGNAMETPVEGQSGLYLQEEDFVAVAEAGFSAVRLPVRFSGHTLKKDPWTLKPRIMGRVDWAIEQAALNDLAIIIDLHHFDPLMRYPEPSKEQFLAIWEQLAEHYKDAPDHVFFEILNEPYDAIIPFWNEYLIEALTIIRKTNPTRPVIIGPTSWNNVNDLQFLELPEDDRNIIVTFHNYSPFEFTHQGASWVGGSGEWLGKTWSGTDAEKADMEALFDIATDWASEHNRPLFMGEFGAYSKADEESREAWTTFVTAEAERRGISWAYWEYASGFGAYNRGNKTWNPSLLGALLPDSPIFAQEAETETESTTTENSSASEEASSVSGNTEESTEEPVASTELASEDLVLNDTFETDLAAGVNSFGNSIGFHTWGDTTDNVTLERTLISLESELAREGQTAETNVLQINRAIDSWGGFTNVFTDGAELSALDLSAYTGVSFWFYGTAEGDPIFFELFDNSSDESHDTAERFEIGFTNDFEGWQFIEIPFEDLRRRADWQPGGEPNDGLGLNASTGYAFRWGASTGTTYIDDVKVYKSDLAADDSIRISLSDSAFTISEGSDLTLTLNLNRASEEAVSVRYLFAEDSAAENKARAYRDFVAKSELVVFPAGVSEQNIEIKSIDDDFYEANESFKLVLEPVVGLKLGKQNTATLTLIDNDTKDNDLLDNFNTPLNYSTQGELTLNWLELSTRAEQVRPEQNSFENMLKVNWQSEASFALEPALQDWQYVEGISFWYLGSGSNQEVFLELSGDTKTRLSFNDLAEWQPLSFELTDLSSVSEYRFVLPDLAEGQAFFDELRLESSLDYKNASLPTRDRVTHLLSQMTLEEKIGQMTLIDVAQLMGNGEWDRGPLNETQLKRMFETNQVGALLSGGGAAPIPNTPEAWAGMTNALQEATLKYSRLDIPTLYGIDAVHGHNNVQGATIYPHNIGLGASWNPALIEEISARVAQDLKAVGTPWTYAPVADIARDARWGRFYESFGEDPLLVSDLVAASVRGFQSSQGIAATVKHFTGYGQALNGFDRNPTLLDMRSLRTIHLPSFQAAINEGALTMMVNSGSVNGVPVHASSYLLQDLAREQLGFDGLMVSDWEDIHKLVNVHKTAANFKDAVAMSINAGVDMYMVPHNADEFTSTLKELVQDDLVSEERIDNAVSNILYLKFELGLFENPFVDASLAQSIVVEEDRALAKQAALESITLLKNKDLLPFNEDIKNILVLGPNANNLANQMGGWTIGWQGIGDSNELPPGLTILEALQENLGEGLSVSHLDNEQDLQAVSQASEQADAVVVVLGETPYAEGEGNRENLSLPIEQLLLLRVLSETNTPVVAVLVAGRPLIIPEDMLADIDSLIMAYLPGSEAGTALNDILFGHYNPSGKLPFSWPRNTGQLPITYDALAGSAYNPLYAFGHGLSYTRFSQKNLELNSTSSNVSLSIDIENTGNLAGSEIVQVFVTYPATGLLASQRKLVGFSKITLEPNESQNVSINVPLSALEIIAGDILGNAEPTLIAGKYTFTIGRQFKTLEIP